MRIIVVLALFLGFRIIILLGLYIYICRGPSIFGNLHVYMHGKSPRSRSSHKPANRPENE